MSNCDIKDSIIRLRELRNQLCEENKDPSNWKEAFKARDFVVEHLQELHCMIADRKVRRKKLEQKSAFILESLHVFLEDEAGEKK
jgi:hypothetical protein|tara:strand:+ start:765 stop:1019 length:255 start_codon:yes stop_codon:yes gene_type:complete